MWHSCIVLQSPAVLLSTAFESKSTSLLKLTCFMYAKNQEQKVVSLQHFRQSKQCNCQCLQVFVNFLCLTVAFQQTTQHSHTSNPHNLLWHTGICCTLALSSASMPTFASCESILADTGTRMHCHGFSNNKTIFNELADVLSCSTHIKQQGQ